MIYTEIIIASVAIIAGTVGNEVVVNHTSHTVYLDEFSGYRCNDPFNAFINATVYPKLYECLGAGKWETFNLSTLPLPSELPAFCCFHYVVMSIEQSLTNRYCPYRLGFHNLVENDYYYWCQKSGHPISDKYCRQRPEYRPLAPDCGQFVYNLLDVSHPLLVANDWLCDCRPTVTTRSPSTGGTADRPALNTTALAIVLAAIVNGF